MRKRDEMERIELYLPPIVGAMVGAMIGVALQLLLMTMLESKEEGA